jgi:hypothetical protein
MLPRFRCSRCSRPQRIETTGLQKFQIPPRF